MKANEMRSNKKFSKDEFTYSNIKELIKLSKYNDGPLQAVKYLKSFGISLIIEPHLPKTYLDGAAILLNRENPIIGLTLRFDRIDNFWFTLAHELGHVLLHLDQENDTYFDDLEAIDDNHFELEADDFAREMLIPQSEWENSPACHLRSPDAAELLANKLDIHPAIVAGRMRFEFKAYRLLNKLIGNKQVRKLYSDIVWS